MSWRATDKESLELSNMPIGLKTTDIFEFETQIAPDFRRRSATCCALSTSNMLSSEVR